MPNILTLKQNFLKAKEQLQEWEKNKINGLNPMDYIFNKFQQSVDPIYFIENILRAHLPESRRHLHSNQIELVRAACNPFIRKVAAMMARQCFAKGTQLIDTNNNLIRVEDIQIGDKLLTPDNKTATVVNVTSGVSLLYKVEEVNNYDVPYIVTDNHRLVLKGNVIKTVKDCLNDNSPLFGVKCITYGTEHEYQFSREELINIATYLPDNKQVYIDILNSHWTIKYVFIETFLSLYKYNETYKVNNFAYIDVLKRIFWSMGFKIKQDNNYLFIEFSPFVEIKISPYKEDAYYGFTLDSNDHLCVLSDNTVTHNSGKCFAKDTLIRLYNGDVKKVQELIETDVLMGSDSKPRHIESLVRGKEKMANIYTDINHFTVNMSHDLVVYDENNNKQYIPVNEYIEQNLKMKMKVVPWDYDFIYSSVTAYYAGYDHIFNYLLHTSIETRKHILAGLIDSIPINFIKNGIGFYINRKLLMPVKELVQSLGFKAYIKDYGKEVEVSILGNLEDIPVKEKKEVNYINYNNSYIDFSIVPDKEDTYYGFSLRGNNKEFLLADGTVVKNTESIACFCSYLISIYPQMRIGIFTPRVQQAEVTIGRSTVFFQMNEKRLPHQIVKLTKQRIELNNGSYMQAVSGSDQSNIEGLTFDIAVLDEAQKISNYTYSERLVPMLGACQSADCRITLSTGAKKRIEDIVRDKVDTRIVSYDEKTKKVVVGKIINYLDMGIKPVIKFTLESGNDLTVTLDHRLVTWIRDTTPRHADWIQAKNIKVGTRIGVPRILPFFGTVHESNARLLGMLIGDGSYRQGTQVHFGSYSDALWEYVGQFCDNINYYRQFQTNDGKDYRAARMKELTPLVKTAGIYGQVSIEKTLPTNVMMYDKQSVQELLAGLFDTDGNFFYPNDTDKARPTISFANICKSIIDTMQDLLLKLGIRAHIQYRKTKPHELPSGEVKVTKDVYVLHILGKENIEAFYHNIPIIEEDKKANLEKMYEYFKEHKFKIDKSILDTDLRFEKVNKVEFLGPQHVYDLTVDVYHTYIANNIISHNCNGKVIKIGTPRSRNHFYDSVEGKNSKDWCVIRKPWFECEQLWALDSVLLPDHEDPEHKRLRPYSTYVLSLMPKAKKQEYFPTRVDLWTDGEMSIQDFTTQYELGFTDSEANFYSTEQLSMLKNGEFLWQPYGVDGEVYYAGIDFGNSDYLISLYKNKKILEKFILIN